MPLYYFHMLNRIGFVEDEEGMDLPDLETARAEAMDNIRSVLAEDARKGCLDLRGRIDIVDERGEIVLTLPFSEAIDIRTGPVPSETLREAGDQA